MKPNNTWVACGNNSLAIYSMLLAISKAISFTINLSSNFVLLLTKSLTTFDLVHGIIQTKLCFKSGFVNIVYTSQFIFLSSIQSLDQSLFLLKYHSVFNFEYFDIYCSLQVYFFHSNSFASLSSFFFSIA